MPHLRNENVKELVDHLHLVVLQAGEGEAAYRGQHVDHVSVDLTRPVSHQQLEGRIALLLLL